MTKLINLCQKWHHWFFVIKKELAEWGIKIAIVFLFVEFVRSNWTLDYNPLSFRNMKILILPLAQKHKRPEYSFGQFNTNLFLFCLLLFDLFSPNSLEILRNKKLPTNKHKMKFVIRLRSNEQLFKGQTSFLTLSWLNIYLNEKLSFSLLLKVDRPNFGR